MPGNRETHTICPECGDSCRVILIRVREPGHHYNYYGCDLCEALIEGWDMDATEVGDLKREY